MTTRQQQNYNNQAAQYLQALKKGLKDTPVKTKKYDEDDVQYDDDLELQKSASRGSRDRRNTSSSSTSSKKSTVRRSDRIQQQQPKQQPTQLKQPTQQQDDEEHQPKQKQQKLTKRQQVLQRYAQEEASGAASVLASIADAAITRSQLRNQNTFIWTERDRTFASQAAALAIETAQASAGRKKEKKEQPPAYWTRLHEKARSSVRFEKEMGRVHFI
jgi:tellurite resistance protein